MFNKMNKTDHYYFTDSIFQLELNLQNKTRELILMVEEFERQDCPVCCQLKCRRTKQCAAYYATSRIHYSSVNSAKGNILRRAPPADLLPKPKFENEELIEIPCAATPGNEMNKDVEAWLKTSKQEQKPAYVGEDKIMNATDVLLDTLKKTWNEGSVEDLKKQRMILDPRHANSANPVETFFRSFEIQPTSATAANLPHATNKLTAHKQKVRKAEYSYF